MRVPYSLRRYLLLVAVAFCMIHTMRACFSFHHPHHSCTHPLTLQRRPPQVTYSLPYSLMASLTTREGGGQGKASHLPILVPASPSCWNRAFLLLRAMSACQDFH